jgi:hypothetical protein
LVKSLILFFICCLKDAEGFDLSLKVSKKYFRYNKSNKVINDLKIKKNFLLSAAVYGDLKII